MERERAPRASRGCSCHDSVSGTAGGGGGVTLTFCLLGAQNNFLGGGMCICRLLESVVLYLLQCFFFCLLPMSAFFLSCKCCLLLEFI